MIADYSRTGRFFAWLFGLLRRRELALAESGVVIGHDEDGRPEYWNKPTQMAAAHALWLAASGAGKSFILAYALAMEAARSWADDAPERRTTQLIITPKNDITEYYLAALARIAPERLADVVYLDPFGPGFALNLCRLPLHGMAPDIFAIQLAELVATISTATGSQAHLGVGARQVDVLRNMLLGASSARDPRASPLLALDALVETDGPKRLASISSSRSARQFLEGARLGDELRASCAARLRLALAVTERHEHLMAASSCLDFHDLLAPGRIVLVPLGDAPLPALQVFMANLLLRIAAHVPLSRPSPWDGHHIRIVVDEAQVFAPVLADLAELILTQGRSKGVSLVTVSQGTALIADASPTLLPVLLANTNRKYVGRLAIQDSELLAKERAPSPGVEERLSALREGFAVSTANLPDRSFVAMSPGTQRHFRSLDVDLASWERAAAEHANAIADARSRFALPRAVPPRATLTDLVPPRKRERRAAAPAAARGRTRFG